LRGKKASVRLLQEIVRPKIDRAFIQRALRNAGEAGRIYRLVEEKEPATFDAIVEVMATNFRSGATQEQVMILMREQFVERISKPRMKFLADEHLLELYQLFVEMVDQLAQTNPTMCLAMTQGKPFGDLRPYVSADVGRRELALMERMLETRPRQFTLLPAARLQEINTKVAMALYAIHGSAIEVLDPTKQTPGREKAACVMFGEYLKNVLRLPKGEATALLGAMIVDPARLG
jgi:hypothetical protein